MLRTPGPSYSILVRMEIPNRPGMLARVARAIGHAGGSIGAIDIAATRKDSLVRDIVINAADLETGLRIVDEIRRVRGITVIHVADRTFMAHKGGKIEIKNKLPLTSRDDLSMVYTPGVARICTAIRENPARAYDLTIKKNTVAIVTDGSAVLGLGNIGPMAALPVMEGKAMLFKEFGAVDAFPISLDTQNVEEIVRAVKWMAPAFGGINLEDISAPRCFEIEERLKREISIPVFHDDQHGTAVVILAGLINALKIVGKTFENVRVVVSGLGAAGIACIRLLLSVGTAHILGCDRSGILYRGRGKNMNPFKDEIASLTNPDRMKGSLAKALVGTDVFIGLSSPGLVHGRDVKKMARDAIVFAMANPDPEIMPEEASRYARIVATGRSDYPNQINNVLCFPGLFRGILDCRAREINHDMLIAAAAAIASVVEEQELGEDYIIPSVFNRKVPERVAREVIRVALERGVAKIEDGQLPFSGI
jgi:malate dehydrogenase (oxaloacetate-decarboxylating)